MDHTEFVRNLADDKCDPELGARVQRHLQELKLVPVIDDSVAHPPVYNPKIAVQQLEQGISSGFTMLGLDMRNDESLKDTPRRFAKMIVGELTKGLNFDFFPKITIFPNDGRYNQMVLLRNVTTLSLCEHHLQTIDGFTHVAYIPNDKVCGLSKLARVVEFFARRPQVQERMTEQIFEALCLVLNTEDVAVVQDCVHYCMKARGSLQHATSMTTDRLGGRFMSNPSLREEFFDRVNAR